MSKPEIYQIEYPFSLDNENPFDFEDFNPWRPGTIKPDDDEYDEYHYRDQTYFAHGIGRMILEVISRHKPGKYPERTFYIRKWRDPNGKVFGKTQLRITTSQNFRRLCRGYRHKFELIEGN